MSWGAASGLMESVSSDGLDSELVLPYAEKVVPSDIHGMVHGVNEARRNLDGPEPPALGVDHFVAEKRVGGSHCPPSPYISSDVHGQSLKVG